ncbi:PREDICTED: uncharacterized protein LOC105975714 [Erythranthe guttata]|uniref:uncharacterized protein LOC105975714 n=1 Tax=Erythranthe guttata TaxID=4155 RepID=UPI00064DA5AF|nr:PREDICTED: uncharacterized protein LOC105975714 [Erythranthe guttata]|eukprot:XP_012856384.1 PREDICTED: uncharacterized protein LOC105975714 [Erythranthe guttata]
MEEKCSNITAVELRAEEQDEEEEEEEEEALSLSDLPLFHQWRKDQINIEEEESIRSPVMEVKDDFDFCSASKESEMCAADELFFKGRILPFRHSVSSSDTGLLRSGSMDRYYSGGFISSRSSSINSHHSMTSSSSSSAAGCSIPAAVRRPKLPPPRNQFQYSHPSPSPRLHFPNQRTKIAAGRNYAAAKSSPPWNIFRLGLVAAPPDLKSRCPSRNNNFGSRNSNSSSISSGSNSNAKKKKKARVNLLGGAGGCRSCSSDTVDTVAPRVVFYKRCASEGDVAKALLDLQRRKSNNAEDSTMTTDEHVAKKRLSHHRTFEWLKQLSLEEDEA